MESDTPIKSKSTRPSAAADAHNGIDNNDDDAKLQSELDQVRALVAAGGSTASSNAAAKRTPKSKPGTIRQDADLTFGNDDDSPTPLRIPKRKRKDRSTTGSDGDSDDDSDDRGNRKHKKSLIGNMGPVPKRQANPFIDDEADDMDDSDEAEFDYDDSNDGGDDEGVSLNALKKQILGRKLVTTPATPHSNHKEMYLETERVMMAPVPTENGGAAVNSPMANGQSTTRYVVPTELRKELTCAICFETLYQPVSLTCGHSFCEECLGWWLQRNQVPRNQRFDADAANYGSCPTCRAPLACDGRELNVNTSLRACVAALLGDELTDRVLEERKKRLAATRGERGGAHDKGYEVITPAEEGGWVKLGYKLTFRRSTVLDANDQRMQLSMSLWGGPSGDEPLRFDGQRLEMSICLLSMEEDEVGAGGFPRIIRDEDDEHLVCNENRFISTSIVATAKNSNGSGVQVGLASIDEDGVANFSLDVTVGACRRAQSILFRHEDTGAVFEVKIPRDSDFGDDDDNCHEARYSSKARSYLRNDSDHSGDDSENEYEADDFVVMDEDEVEEEEAEINSGDEVVDEDDICCMCREHGELMICDGGDHLAGCGRSFHVACVDRVEVPDGDWVCKRCANAFELDVGVEGYEFPPEEDQGGGAAVPVRPPGGTIDLNDSSGDDDDEEEAAPQNVASEAKKSKAKRRHVLEDSDDD